MSTADLTYKTLDDYQALLPIVSSPQTAHARMGGGTWATGAGADVYWDPERRSFAFMFDGFPELEDGQVYQLWLWSEGAASSGGVFTPTRGGRAATVFESSDGGLKDFDAINVTIEPEGGSLAPTGEVVCTLR